MLSWVLAVATAVTRPASVDCAGIPIAVGTTWTYAANVAWSENGKPRRADVRWTTTEISAKRQGDAITVLIRGWPSELDWYSPGQRPALSVLYCTAGHAYRIEASGLPAAGLLADSLLMGSRAPRASELILVAPLTVGARFGDEDSTRTDGMYAWNVDARTPARAWRAVGARAADSVTTLSLRTLPDNQLIDVVPGIGIVRNRYTHHGTLASVDAKLVAFRRGANAADSVRGRTRGRPVLRP